MTDDHKPGEAWTCPGCGKRTFICYMCRETFHSNTDWTEKQKNDEAIAAFGEIPKDAVSVCDGCHPKAMALMRARMQ